MRYLIPCFCLFCLPCFGQGFGGSQPFRAKPDVIVAIAVEGGSGEAIGTEFSTAIAAERRNLVIVQNPQDYAYVERPGKNALALTSATSHTIEVQAATNLIELFFPNLTDNGVFPGFDGSNINVSDNPLLQSIDAPLLQYVQQGMTINSNAVLNSINFSSLIGNGDFLISANPMLNTLIVPNLQFTYTCAIEDTAITTLDLSSLFNAGDQIQINNNPGLTSIDLTALVQVDGYSPLVRNFVVSGNPRLTTITLTVFNPIQNQIVDWTGNALTQATVDNILALLVAQPFYTSGTVDLSGGSNSAPSAAGLLDVATLQGRGIMVTTN